jgi:hypothetical protein
MENLKQGVAPLIVLRKGINIGSIWKETCKESLLFWKNIQPMK